MAAGGGGGHTRSPSGVSIHTSARGRLLPSFRLERLFSQTRGRVIVSFGNNWIRNPGIHDGSIILLRNGGLAGALGPRIGFQYHGNAECREGFPGVIKRRQSQFDPAWIDSPTKRAVISSPSVLLFLGYHRGVLSPMYNWALPSKSTNASIPLP